MRLAWPWAVEQRPDLMHQWSHHMRRLLDDEEGSASGVEIESTVLFLLAGVCAAAFLPPICCKMRQMFCQSAQVEDSYADED